MGSIGVFPIRLETDGVAIGDPPAFAVEQYGQRTGKNSDELLRPFGVRFGVKPDAGVQLNGIHLEPPGTVERKDGVIPVFSVCFNKRRYGGTRDDFDVRFRAHHERSK